MINEVMHKRLHICKKKFCDLEKVFYLSNLFSKISLHFFKENYLYN